MKVVLTLGVADGEYAVLAATKEDFEKGFSASITSTLPQEAQDVLFDYLVEVTDGTFEGPSSEQVGRLLLDALGDKHPEVFEINPNTEEF